jgi:diguanylate cyclase (GGDEF)-like protein
MSTDARAPIAAGERHFACSLTAGVIGRVRSIGGAPAVLRLLVLADVTHTREYLEDYSNWVSRDDAVALFEAGQQVTGEAAFARLVGETAVRQYAGTPISGALRSLGSIEEMLRQMAAVTSKFSTVTETEVLHVSDGRAELARRVRDGFAPHRMLCDWSLGLLSAAPMIFGSPPATVEEHSCQARGDRECRVTVAWDSALVARLADPAAHIAALEAQLASVCESLDKVYSAAGDLIAEDDVQGTLENITARSAMAVSAPRYLLAVRPKPSEGVQIHSRGVAEEEAQQLADKVLSADPNEVNNRLLLADVRSHERYYGRLAALYDEGQGFFPYERQTLEHYARYAANALDRSMALAEARRGHAETRALLDFARSLAGASSHKVARRLAEAVPRLIDCERVAVFFRHRPTGRLRCVATSGYPGELEKQVRAIEIDPAQTGIDVGGELLDNDEPHVVVFGRDATAPFVGPLLEGIGSRSLVLAPIVLRGVVLGATAVAVDEPAHRLRESGELDDRLLGIGAQAAVGMENGELIDRISFQARHDALTGLANRSFFSERFEQELAARRDNRAPFGLFYVDLDDFKTVNDRYGHQAGDELLCQVAARLLGTVRERDTVARLGGDEFAIILSDAGSASQVDAAAARVAEAFRDSFQLGGCEIAVQASVGRAIWPYDADELDRLMHQADASMYTAKRASATDIQPQSQPQPQT